MKSKHIKPPIYYPIFLNIQGKRCVVIGGGKVALRKVKMLLDCRANVSVISPKPHPDIAKLSKERAIHLIQREYETQDLKGAVMAIVCTDVKEINRKVADEAKKTGILVNVADDPGPSDFIIPAFFRRGNLTLAVSTSGKSPALARKIRTKLEKSFGEEYASLLSLIGEVRSTLKEKGYIVDAEAWQEALDLDLLIQLVRSGQRKKAKVILLSKLKGHKPESA
ncbi:MAG: bifunctional precorrin-2 dehydrogenase/sirohydrochlorin ferrochelatase [Thermodesulfobacteriota bacterium]